MTDEINYAGELYRETPNMKTTPHGPQNTHPTRLSCRDGTMYSLFPGIPCSVVGYYETRWHPNNGYFFPSVDYVHPDIKPRRLSLGDVADRVGYIPTLSQEGWGSYIRATIDNVYSVNGHRHLDNAVWIPWLSGGHGRPAPYSSLWNFVARGEYNGDSGQYRAYSIGGTTAFRADKLGLSVTRDGDKQLPRAGFGDWIENYGTRKAYWNAQSDYLAVRAMVAYLGISIARLSPNKKIKTKYPHPAIAGQVRCQRLLLQDTRIGNTLTSA